MCPLVFWETDVSGSLCWTGRYCKERHLEVLSHQHCRPSVLTESCTAGVVNLIGKYWMITHFHESICQNLHSGVTAEVSAVWKCGYPPRCLLLCVVESRPSYVRVTCLTFHHKWILWLPMRLSLLLVDVPVLEWRQACTFNGSSDQHL